MLTIRRAQDRGHFDMGWLNTYHTFSFGDYQDPKHVHFRTLRVINEDVVVPGEGFETHGHENMEIITYVLEGTLQHQDSLGNGSSIRPCEVQRMSAGRGITHSEFNASKTEPVHLLQIWIFPEKKGLTPSYEQKTFKKEQHEGKLLKIASPTGGAEAVKIHQDANIYVSELKSGQMVSHRNRAARGVWIHVARGQLELQVKGQMHSLRAGDGASIEEDTDLQLTSPSSAEFLLFDLK